MNKKSIFGNVIIIALGGFLFGYKNQDRQDKKIHKLSPFSLLIFLVLTAFAAVLPGSAAVIMATNNTPAELFVAKNGNDNWSGTLAEPNPEGTDGPFATLERARDKIRMIRAYGGIPEGGINVWIRGGIYMRNKSFVLTAEDSGTPLSPVVYSCFKNEKPRITGGIELGNGLFEGITDTILKRRLPYSWKTKKLDLDKIGGIPLPVPAIAEYTLGAGSGMRSPSRSFLLTDSV